MNANEYNFIKILNVQKPPTAAPMYRPIETPQVNGAEDLPRPVPFDPNQDEKNVDASSESGSTDDEVLVDPVPSQTPPTTGPTSQPLARKKIPKVDKEKEWDLREALVKRAEEKVVT